MAAEKRRRSSENEKSKDVLSIVSTRKRDEKKRSKKRSGDTKMYRRSLKVQERCRIWENVELVNAIKSEVLVDSNYREIRCRDERYD